MADGRPSERGILEIADDTGAVVSGVNRLRLGPGMTLTRNDNDPSAVIDATGGVLSTLSSVSVNTVSDLRGLSALTMAVARFAQTAGYSAAADGGGASYRWVSGNTDTDDGALTIKVTAVASGRWKFVMPADRIFPLASCSIASDGTTRVGADLTSLVARLYAAGYYGIRGGPGRRYNVTAISVGETAYDIVPRTEGYPWRHYDVSFCGDGPSAGLLTSITANITVETGFSGSGDTQPLAVVPYGPRTCTQTLYAGGKVFTDLTEIRNLYVGDTVLARNGSDPTDASGVAHSYQMSKVAVVTGTTGNAGNVTLTSRCPETPPYPLPSYNINLLRDGNKHDLLKVTAFQDNLLFENCRFDDTLFAGQFTRRLSVVNPSSDSCAAAFILFASEDADISCAHYKKVKGINTNAGDPTVNPFSNYGWFLVLNSSRNTTVDNLRIDSLDASIGICNLELQCRNTHFTGVTQVRYDTNQGGPLNVNNSFIDTPYSSGIVEIDHFASDGGGFLPAASVNARFKSVHLGITDAYSGSLTPDGSQIFWLGAGRISDFLTFRGKEYRDKKSCTVLCSGLSASSTKTFPIPTNGIVRKCRVYSSSLTGIVNFSIRGTDARYPGTDQTSLLAAGAWRDLLSPTLLHFASQNYGSDVQWISVQTNGSLVAGTYFVVEIEVWQPGGTRDGNDTTTDASARGLYAVTDAPSSNADFLGQEVLGDAGAAWYKAKSIGSGASDWVKLSGNGDMLKSDNLSGLANVATARTNLGLGSAALAPSSAFDGAGTAEAERNYLLTIVPSRLERATVSGASTWTSSAFAAATYERIIIRFRGTHSGSLRLRLGSDTGGNYSWASQVLGGTIALPTITGDCFDGDTAFVVGRSDSGASKVELYVEMDVFVDGNQRAGTVKYTSFGSGADDFRTQFNGLRWKNTSLDPTSVTVLPDTGTMTGVFEVWALPI